MRRFWYGVLLLLLVFSGASGPDPQAAQAASGATAEPSVAESTEAGPAASGPPVVDARLPLYTPTEQPVPGALRIAGTVATFPLAEQLATALEAQQPGMQIQAQSIEAAQTPPWWDLAADETVALLGERMTDAEVAAFERQWGYAPTYLRVALNAVAVVVHPRNPMAERALTLQELRAVFGRQPAGEQALQWGDLGLRGVWAERPITRYGHDASTDLFVYFRRRVLEGGLFAASVNRQPSSAAVIDAVGSDIAAIGYTGLRYVAPGVAVVPLRRVPGTTAVVPTADNLLRQRYPLGHFVHLYVNRQPDAALDREHRVLLRFVFSRQGQHTVAAQGYVPLPSHAVVQELRRVGLGAAVRRKL